MKIRDFFKFEVIVGVFIICVFFYFVWTAKKRKYPFFDSEKKGKSLKSLFKLKWNKPKNSKGKGSGTSKNEVRIGKILEQIFPNRVFKKIRPKWLINPATGKCLELDFFNEHIATPLGKGLGVEVDGVQHSLYSPYFHRNPTEFTYQLKKDQFKDKRCKEQGVMLIRVPHFIVPINQKEYLIKKFTERGVI